MCGIAGWFDVERDLSNEKAVLKRMADALTPRGPDAAGYYTSPRCALAHRRLAVVDIENGAQPMTLRHGGVKYTLTYNGELYNTSELRTELSAHGFTFRGHGDTEVLLAAYAMWGGGCLSHLNGIYAFAVLSERFSTENGAEYGGAALFLARDRVGVKPLFFYHYTGGIIFASELKSLLRHEYVHPTVPRESLLDILLLSPARRPGSGVYTNVYELKPGQCASYTIPGRNLPPRLNVRTYWQLKARRHTDNFEETAAHTRLLIKDAIRRQLVSDVPLCAFLSGGLDSSVICAVASAERKELGLPPLDTYSVDYKGNRENFKRSVFQPDEDAPWIKVMSEMFGTNHRDCVIDTHALAEALTPAAYARDLPGMADVDSSLYLFCKEVRENFTVAVSGECADEIFGGYPWYAAAAGGNLPQGFPWARNTADRAALLRRDVLGDISAEEYINAAAADTLNEADLLGYASGNTGENDDGIRQMFQLNFYWFMQTLLDRKDRMSMANSLEVRVPFCDHRIAEYAYNIPWEYKNYRSREKGLVRYAFEKDLPRGITWRKKSPYPKTHNPAYLHTVREMLASVINNPNGCRLSQYFNINEVRKLLNEERDIKWYGQLMALPQTIAYLLQMELWLAGIEQ